MPEKKKQTPDSCRFNPGVICQEQSRCEKCGWNPSVHKARAENAQRSAAVVVEPSGGSA